MRISVQLPLPLGRRALPRRAAPAPAQRAASSPASLPRGKWLSGRAIAGGSAQEAIYTAADQKFVLSGGEPTIIDANSDTTTGHSLTFFVANDTILIDSQEGLRTLTKHRVEK